MRLGIVAALADEARILAEGPVSTKNAVLIRNDALLKLSGIGPERARAAARSLIGLGAGALVSWGIAAGLAPDMIPGSLIIPETVIDPEGETYWTDSSWRLRISRRLGVRMPVSNGRLVQCAYTLAGKREKIEMAARTGAVAADMESAAVAAEAVKAGMPFLAVRAISDTVETSVPSSALNSIDEFGRVRPFRLMTFLARHPGQIGSLIRLGRSYRIACNSLRVVAREGNMFWIEH